MSNLKKYLLLGTGVALLAWSVVCAIYAIQAIVNPLLLNPIASDMAVNWGMEFDPALRLLQFGVAFLASSAVVSLGFAGFCIRYFFYTPYEYEQKHTIVLTMAVLSFVVVNPVIGGLFLAAALVPDRNYVAKEPVNIIDGLEEKLNKLNELKEKNLISEEEYNKLRQNLLNS